MAPRVFPLRPPAGPPAYRIHFHKRFLEEVAERQYAEATLAEVQEALSVNPSAPFPGTTEKVEGHKRLRRYKPKTDPNIRIYYGIETKDVYVVVAEIRENAYRKNNFRTALARLASFLAQEPPALPTGPSEGKKGK